MAALAIEISILICAHAMAVYFPIFVYCGRRFPMQVTWLGRIVAARTVGDGPILFPGSLGSSYTTSVTMTIIADFSFAQPLKIGEGHLAIAMLCLLVAADFLMAVSARNIDIIIVVAIVRT